MNHLSGAPLFKRLLGLPTNIRLELLLAMESPSLLQAFINYVLKRFYKH